MIKGKPFVKWAGGKRQIINELKKYVPESIISELYDPMCEASFRKYKPKEKEERKN